MSWNYRIVKYRDDAGFGLHEVYYEDGKATARSSEGCRFQCDTEEGPEGIQGSLQQALTDANCRPVFVDPVNWPTGVDGDAA